MAKYIIYQEATVKLHRCVVVDAPNISSAIQKGKVAAIEVPWSHPEEIDTIRSEKTSAVEVPQ